MIPLKAIEDEEYPRVFVELAALIQEGIDAARISLPQASLHAPGPKSARAISLVTTKLDEAELWLGAAIIESAKELA